MERTLFTGLCCCRAFTVRRVILGSSAWWCFSRLHCKLPQGKSRCVYYKDGSLRQGAGFAAGSRNVLNHPSKLPHVLFRGVYVHPALNLQAPLSSPYRYSAIRKKLDELDQITHQTLLDLYDYNMSLAGSDWSTLSTRKRSSRSLLHHVQRHPLRRQKRDNLVNLPENSPSVDKNDWKIGFVLVRSLDILCPTGSGLCQAISVLLDPWPCLSLHRSLINLHWLLLMTDKGRAESFAQCNPAPQVLSLSMWAPDLSMSVPVFS